MIDVMYLSSIYSVFLTSKRPIGLMVCIFDCRASKFDSRVRVVKFSVGFLLYRDINIILVRSLKFAVFYMCASGKTLSRRSCAYVYIYLNVGRCRPSRL